MNNKLITKDVEKESYIVIIYFDEDKLKDKEKEELYSEFYKICNQYGYKYKLKKDIVFNESKDITKPFIFIQKGLKKSWIKYFIKKILIYKVYPNSDAIDIIKQEEEIVNIPKWVKEKFKNFQ